MAVDVQMRRIFEVYVDELVARSQGIDELLLVRLRYFGDDVEQVSKRLRENPEMVVELVHHLSARMQELDTEAGASENARTAVERARSLALVLPESAVVGDAPIDEVQDDDRRRTT